MNRPFAHWDWSLRSCGAHGHVTYRPDEPELAERLGVTTVSGEAWRCLRCGDYVSGPPHGSGPADEAPIVPRGAALRDAFILRLLAVERLLRALLLFLLAYAIHRFQNAQTALREMFHSYLPMFQPIADRLGIDLATLGPIKFIEKVLNYGSGTLEWVTTAIIAYGCLQLLEALGLWLMRRWGEYVAVIGTGVFIPLEIYEILEKQTWLRFAALALNLFAVIYIVWTKRLFGLRGGRKAFEAQRHAASLIEIEKAALAPRKAQAPASPAEAQ